MTFSHGFIDFVLLYAKSSHAIWLLVIGPIWALVYYGTFRWLIVRFNLKTPGREVEEAVETRNVEGDELSRQLVLAFGGRSNIKNLDACITRLRVELGNVSLANAERLKALGAAGVITVGNSMQAIFGTQAENLKTAMAEYLESAGPEADLTAAPQIVAASITPAVIQSAVVDPEIEKKGSQFIAALGGPSNIEELALAIWAQADMGPARVRSLPSCSLANATKIITKGALSIRSLTIMNRRIRILLALTLSTLGRRMPCVF